jgi:hypothetical protein
MEDGAVGHNFERHPPWDHPCQVWLNSVQGFQRRRFKYESFEIFKMLILFVLYFKNYKR